VKRGIECVFDNLPPKKRGPKAKWERIMEQQAAEAAAAAASGSGMADGVWDDTTAGDAGGSGVAPVAAVKALLSENMDLRQMVGKYQAQIAVQGGSPLAGKPRVLPTARASRPEADPSALDHPDDIEAVGAMLHLANDSPASGGGDRGIDAWQLPGPIIPTAEEECIM